MKFDRIISADSHIMEPLDLWTSALGDRFGDQTPRGLHEFSGKAGTFFFSGREVLTMGDPESEAGAGLAEAGYDPVKRVAFQEQAGVEAELIYPTLGIVMLRNNPCDMLHPAAAVYNDWAGEFCSHDPKRLIGLAMLPVDDVAWAVQELHRCIKLGFKGAMINTLPPEGCPPYRDPAYDPLWQAAAETGMPLTLHALAGRTPSPFGFHKPEEHAEGPRTMLLAFAEIADVLANEFIFGTILDRFPDLKLISMEYELSWMPHFMWRLDQMQSSFTFYMDLPKLERTASEYITQRIWHGMIDDPLAAEAIPHIGTDRIMWGSDFPHVRSIGLNAQSKLAELFGNFSAEERDQMIVTTVSNVYQL